MNQPARIKIDADSQPLRRFAATAIMTIEMIAYETDVGVLVRESERASGVAAAARALNDLSSDADRACQELDRVSLFAKWRAGCVLSTLDPGHKGGRGKLSARREAARSAGICDAQACRLVKFASLSQDQVIELIDAIQSSGHRPTMGGVLRRAVKRSLVPRPKSRSSRRTITIPADMWDQICDLVGEDDVQSYCEAVIASSLQASDT